MALNRIIADSIADGTVVASDIADGTITLAKLQSGLLPPATANSAAAYANAAFATANTGTASGSYANSAFATANTVTSAATYANGAFIKANSSVSLTANVSGTLPVGNGGTGSTTLTANNVILGNTTSAVQFVAPGTTGNLLTSNGTTWTSAAASGGVTSAVAGNGISVSGSTGAVTFSLGAPSSDSVGSYCWGGSISLTAGFYGVGTTVAGSSIRMTSAPNTVATNCDYNPSFSGTWRLQGYTQGFNCGSPGYSRQNVWMRIS